MNPAFPKRRIGDLERKGGVKTKELRNFSKDELLQKEKSLREEVFKLNAQRYTGRVEKPHMFSLLKKDIARIRTLLNEKKEDK